MIARMRALRATREDAPTKLSEDAPGESAVEQRFAAGQRVRAVPYGEGVVRQSRVVAGRELLDIDFPDAGLIAVDAVRGLVRLSEPEPAAPDDEA